MKTKQEYFEEIRLLINNAEDNLDDKDFQDLLDLIEEEIES